MSKSIADDSKTYFYEFFNAKKEYYRPNKKIADWELFLGRLGFNLDNATEETRFDVRIMKDFQTHIFNNITWYERQIVKEKTSRAIWITVSLILLLMVPIAVSFLSSTAVTAQLVGVLTGIFALYEGFSKWLEKRNLVSVFWQTSSNLKSRLFSLHDKWQYAAGTGWQQEDIVEFTKDLYEAIDFGLRSQKVEKQFFFNNYSYPQFNVLGSILNTRTLVKELLKPAVTPNQPQSSLPLVTDITLRRQLDQLTQEADKPTTKRAEKKDRADEPIPLWSIFQKEKPINAPKIVMRSEWGAQPPKKPLVDLGLIKSIVVHHAAGYWTTSGDDDGKARVKEIQKLHQDPIADDGRNWNDIGYHFLIDPNGDIYQGRAYFHDKPMEEKPLLARGAHVLNHNRGRIGICLLGNFQPPKGTMKPSPKAKNALVHLISFLIQKYKPIGDDNPDVKGQLITGHRDYKATDCPGDTLYTWLNEVRERVKKGII